MAINVVNGSTSKPVATAALVAALRNLPDLEGQLYTGFPILLAQSDLGFADALLVSPNHGVVVFDLVEGSDPEGYSTRQDELQRVLLSRLLQHKGLVSKRRLVPNISTLTFAPALRLDSPAASADASAVDDDYFLADSATLGAVMQSLPQSIEQTAYYPTVLSAIQNLTTLRKSRTPRAAANPASRGAKLAELELSIATLDHLQSKAVIETIEGVQRIRGLAGSGKTVVLALKAAYLHARNPDWKIAVTFNTRSLKDQFRRLITSFSLDQSGEEPNWENLRILNAWGGLGGGEKSGIYSTFCETNDAQYFNFGAASQKFRSQYAFEDACTLALEERKRPNAVFDVILVDEAQDLPPAFLKMCFEMLQPSKRLVYAYDELQSLNGRGLPSPTEIFGSDAQGRPHVDFEVAGASDETARDIVLRQCYRNSRPVLVSAHALGFGIYRKPPLGQSTGLVQLFDNPHLWTDIGYSIESGQLRENDDVVLARTPESSPPFLERISPLSDLIQFHSFESQAAQDEWVANEIQKNIGDDELRYDDVVVINPNGITARNNLSPLRARLLAAGVPNHLAGVDTSADVFFNRDNESITFTGIHRAKGNEAGMVYVVNAQEGMDAVANLSAIRNRLFTAITRSKAWVRVVGVGPLMDQLVAEYKHVEANAFTLQFRYPTEPERAKLNLLHRELTPQQQANVSRQRTSAMALLDDLEKERIYADDLDPTVRGRLLEILRDSANE
ncbi:Superfamily I DNA and RNA helicases [Cryobacterium flavum]|uniref:Helicase n=1 Tax=Cryobacterium flavum TaxID=1424659 RepID=A0A4R8V1I3_9MICO|nr:ATP-binding domain-containing protein [Cryobacterium flavum]TFB76077.1 helicase [Cryobacterium flavum]SDO01306.1 Superfamily I DNA and RNA helicases [Cryobacterium flavum]